MKMTPLYELSVALRGRSKLFQSIVICAFTGSFLIMAVCGIQLHKNQEDSTVKTKVLHNKPQTHHLASINR